MRTEPSLLHAKSAPLPDHSAYGLSAAQMLQESWSNLRLLGRRSILALLGIAIGCAAVVALSTIGHNAQQEAMQVFRNMGSDLLIATVQPSRHAPNPPDTPLQLNSSTLPQAVPSLRSVTPLILNSAEIQWHKKIDGTVILASDTTLNQALNLQVAQGRLLSDFDHQSTFAVLGAKRAAELNQLGATVEVGSSIQLGNYLFEVVGILQEQGWNPLIPVSVDHVVLLPLGGVKRLSPNLHISSVIARSYSDEPPPQAASELQSWLSQQIPGFDIQVQSPQLLVASKAQQSQLFSWLLIGLSVISLLAGGIGVMNVMVMSVSERRQEIGVRMALGARAKDIGRLFLLEAIFLSIAGAVFGALLGIGAAYLFVLFSNWAAFSLSWLALPLGIGSALVTGLFFGLYPALSAARLEPVRALRHD